MVDLDLNDHTPKRDPKAVLMAMERGVFDAVIALSAAMDKGFIVGFLTFPSANGCGLELIFPTKPDAPDDAPNPSRKIEAATPAAVLAMAGEIANQLIVIDYQNGGAHQDYMDMRANHRQVRTSVLAVPKLLLPGVN